VQDEKIRDSRRLGRCLLYRRLVATVIALRFFVLAAGVGAQTTLSMLYDVDVTNSDLAPASAPLSAQTPWSQFVKSWDSLRKQLDNRGIQFGIVYDGEVFSNTSGGLRRGTLYLGNLNLQLTLDGQHLIGWPGGAGRKNG